MNRSDAGKLGWKKSRYKREQRHVKFVENYYSNPKKCKTCGRIIIFDKRQNDFCNHSCAATFNNKGNSRNLKGGLFAIDRHFCKFCKKEMVVRRGKVFCSQVCRKNYDWAVLVQRIEDTKEIVTNTTTIAKKYLIFKNGYCCFVCGINKWLGQKLPLILDHINGNSDDWSLFNLRLLCSNCDSLTPTYKGKNIGNGRVRRRQKYKEMKASLV